MKHLENYGVQALSTEELKSTDGGYLWGGAKGRMVAFSSVAFDFAVGFYQGFSITPY